MCSDLYKTMGVWTQLSEDKEQQEISQKIQAVQEKAQKFKEVMGTLPPAEVVTMMNENRKLYSEMNQLRVEQQARAQQIEVLQDEAYRVTTTLATTQGIIKQEVDESVEKMQAQITAETVDQILQKEIEVKEKVVTVKETFKKFMVHWKKA
jgi:hypothetical protein